jgi:Tfp pilus assembly protein PilE
MDGGTQPVSEKALMRTVLELVVVIVFALLSGVQYFNYDNAIAKAKSEFVQEAKFLNDQYNQARTYAAKIEQRCIIGADGKKKGPSWEFVGGQMFMRSGNE